MSIKEIKSETLYKEFSFEIPYDEVNVIIDSKIKEILPTVSLPGFRKGKAPINIVRKKYEDNIISEAIEKLVQDKTKDLLDTRNLKPFVQPRVDLKKYKKNEPVEVEVKINLEPEIKLKDFQKIEVNKYEIDLDKSLVEKNYTEFLSSQKKYSSIKSNREIKKSDKVLINLLSEDSSVPQFLKVQKNLPIIIDSEFQILPELGPKIIKMKLKKGDKNKIKLDISNSLKLNKEKIVEFDIEILDIEESIPFIVDKEFLEKNNLKNETELKTNLEKNLKAQYQNGLKQIEKKILLMMLA